MGIDANGGGRKYTEHHAKTRVFSSRDAIANTDL